MTVRKKLFRMPCAIYCVVVPTFGSNLLYIAIKTTNFLLLKRPNSLALVGRKCATSCLKKMFNLVLGQLLMRRQKLRYKQFERLFEAVT